MPHPSRTDVTGPRPDVREAAANIRPMLAAQADRSDRECALTGASVGALRSSGLLSMLTPTAHGGAGVSLVEALDAVDEVARGDSSAGWLTMIFACADHVVSLFDVRTQAEVYCSGPDTSVCAVFTPSATAEPTPGGWVLDGRWAPASGCHLADWALLGFSSGAEHAFALVPVADLEIQSTWDALGVRATAGDTLIGVRVPVPEHRVLRVGPALTGAERGSGSRALTPVLLTMLVAPLLGMASAALDLVVGSAWDKGVAFTTYDVRAESTAFQVQVADAATRIDAARALAQRSAHDVDAHATAGTHPDFAERARARGWAGHAVAECRAAVDVLGSAHGASAFAAANPFARIVRDVQTASRHAMAAPAANAEVYGRALLGVEPAVSTLI